MSISVITGTHEEIYDLLRSDDIDIAINDQRRAFSGMYHNLILSESRIYIEISARNSLSKLKQIEIDDLKNTPCILVANDEVAKDEMRQSMLRLSKPQGMKLVIKSIEDSVKSIKSGVTDKYKMFIVVNNIQDVERLAKEIPELNYVNLGVLPANENTKALSKAINVTSEDVKTLKKLLAKNIEIDIQQVPTEAITHVDEKLLES